MRAAIAAAVVGDEQEREDPTVLELERRGAELLGQAEAVFLPTATMANQIALRILTEPGDELLAEETSHVMIYEQGAPAAFSGLVMRGLPELMAKARRAKHLFGGAMRQAGIVAAAGVYAFDHHLERLADDHRRARVLAERLSEAGLPVDPEQVETNFVHVDVAPLGLTADEALARLRAEGVALSDRKSTRLNSSHTVISYAVFCLK